MTPDTARSVDLALAREVAAELSDRYGMALRIVRVSSLSAGPFLLMSDLSNPLVRQYCEFLQAHIPVVQTGVDSRAAEDQRDVGAVGKRSVVPRIGRPRCQEEK